MGLCCCIVKLLSMNKIGLSDSLSVSGSLSICLSTKELTGMPPELPTFQGFFLVAITISHEYCQWSNCWVKNNHLYITTNPLLQKWVHYKMQIKLEKIILLGLYRNTFCSSWPSLSENILKLTLKDVVLMCMEHLMWDAWGALLFWCINAKLTMQPSLVCKLYVVKKFLSFFDADLTELPQQNITSLSHVMHVVSINIKSHFRYWILTTCWCSWNQRNF